MSIIRQLNLFHISKISELLSKFCDIEPLSKTALLKEIPFAFFQSALPLNFRSAPESFVALGDNNTLNALITVVPAKGNHRKILIKRLFINKNSFDAGKQLTDYVVTKFGAMGADTFCAFIDEDDDTSSGFFSKMCGFRLCSREVLSKMTVSGFADSGFSKEKFLNFNNSDASAVAQLFNDSIASHFRYSLEREPSEFKDDFLKELSANYTFKYVVRDINNEKIICFAQIDSFGVKNKIIDIVLTKPFESLYPDILKGLTAVIKNRSTHYNIYVLCRNYFSCSKDFEAFLNEEKFQVTESKLVFVKDFFKPLKTNDAFSKPAVILSEISGKPAFIESPLQNFD